MKLHSRAFTLTELIVVISIIGILSAVLIPSMLGYVEKAKYSNDISLCRNINQVLETEEIIFGSPNDVTLLQNMLEDKFGLKLETKSKGNYLFYNESENRVFLGKLNDLGLDSGKNVSASSSDSFVSSLSAPEKFIEDVWLLNTASRDNLANYVCSIRNASSQAVLEESLLKVKSINERLGELLYDLVDSSVFLDEQGNQIKASTTNNSNIVRTIYNRNTRRITVDSFNNLNNLSIIDLPDTIEEVEKGSFDKIMKENLVITCPNEKVKNLIEEPVLEKVILLKNRSDNIINVDLNIGTKIKRYELYYTCINGIYSGSLASIPMDNYLPSKEDKIAYNLKGLVKSELLGTPEIIFENNHSYIDLSDNNITDLISFNQNKKINLSCVYIKETAESKVNDAYFSLVSGIKYANRLLVETNVYLIKNATLKSELKVGTNVNLILPFDNDFHAAVLEGKEAADIYGKAVARIRPRGLTKPLLERYSKTEIIEKDPYLTLTLDENISLDIMGKLIVGGDIGAIAGDTASCYMANQYSKINLLSNSCINIYGDLKVYGIIDGVGKVNGLDGTVLEMLTIEDHFGGSNMAVLIGKNIFPFNAYTIERISAELNLFPECSYVLETGVYTDKKKNGSCEIPPKFSLCKIIFASSDQSGLFTPVNNNKALPYITKTITNGLVDIKVHQDIEDNAISIKLDNNNVNLGRTSFPLTGMNINVGSNAVAKLSNKYKLLPSAKITVDGILEIEETGGILVYDSFERGDGHNFSKAKKPTYYYNTDSALPAELVVNNKLIVSGIIGGVVSPGKNATLVLNDTTKKFDDSVIGFKKFIEGNGKTDGFKKVFTEISYNSGQENLFLKLIQKQVVENATAYILLTTKLVGTYTALPINDTQYYWSHNNA